MANQVAANQGGASETQVGQTSHHVVSPNYKFVDLYKKELVAIETRRKTAFKEDLTNPESPSSRGSHDVRSEAGQPDGLRIENSLVGLALSGGGLRSATFNLGLLQAFRQTGLLRYIDFLSSVSGGGYTAGYLAAVTHQTELYHDSERGSPAKLSQEDDKRFSRCGWYLYAPFEFGYEYFLSTVALLGTFICGLMALAYLLAATWRLFDYPLVRDWLSIVGLEADLFAAFVPSLLLGLFCAVAFAGDVIAYRFRNSDKRSRLVQAICIGLILAPGIALLNWPMGVQWIEFRIEAMLLILSMIGLVAVINWVGYAIRARLQKEQLSSPQQQYWISYILFVGALCSLPVALVVVIANGDLSLGWIGELIGVSNTTLQQVVRQPILFLVVLSLLAMFRYRHLLRSRRPTASPLERYFSKAVLAVIVFGVPLLMIGWAAVENGSGFASNQPTDLRWYHVRNWRAFDDLAKSEHEQHWWAGGLLGDVMTEAASKPIEVGNVESGYVAIGIYNSTAMKEEFEEELKLAREMAQPEDEYSELLSEAQTAVDEFSKASDESKSLRQALRASLALERLYEAIVHGPEGWVEHDMPIYGSQGIFSRWGMVVCGTLRPKRRQNPAVAYTRIRTVSRLIQDDICGEITKLQKSGVLTGALENSLRARAKTIGKTDEPGLSMVVVEILDKLKSNRPSYRSEVDGLSNIERDLVRASDTDANSGSPTLDVANQGNAYWTERNVPLFDRTIMFALYPDVFKSPEMVSTFVVVGEDQAERLEYFFMFGFAFVFLLAVLPVNRISPIYNYYRRKLLNTFLQPVSSKPVQGFDSSGRILLKDLKGHEHGGPLQLFLAALHLTVDVKPVFDGRAVADMNSRRHYSLLYSPLANGTVASGFLSHDDERQHRPRTLDEAVTISGAAVSPMAVVDRPLRWVLSALNLRTGQWVRNPRFDSDAEIRAWEIVREWISELAPPKHTPDEERWRVGSAADGGYHEFLGLSELINRRCRLVIVSDAGTNDDATEFEVLADAIRIAKNDHNVELLDLDNDEPLSIDRLRRHGPDNYSAQHYIMGRIRYPDDEMTPNAPREGILLYLQMSMTGDEDVDLRQFHKSNENFPDEPITNQFFDEKLVEAFRSLGKHIGLSMTRQMPAAETISDTREFLTTEDLLESLIRAYATHCAAEKNVEEDDADGSIVSLPKWTDEDFSILKAVEASIGNYERNSHFRREVNKEISVCYRSNQIEKHVERANAGVLNLIAPWAMAASRMESNSPNEPLKLFQVGGRSRLVRICTQFMQEVECILIDPENNETNEEVLQRIKNSLTLFLQRVQSGVFRSMGSKGAATLSRSIISDFPAGIADKLSELLSTSNVDAARLSSSSSRSKKSKSD